ncbi:MAG: hypothetical protein J6B01_03895 [Ruminococcus sp.]|nr:hypothetical protein [Ruminococcus sp.]
MTTKIPIRTPQLPKTPRVFDVTVNENGDIIRYDMQNIKGTLFIDQAEVKKQIQAALKEKSCIV